MKMNSINRYNGVNVSKCDRKYITVMIALEVYLCHMDFFKCATVQFIFQSVKFRCKRNPTQYYSANLHELIFDTQNVAIF